MGWCWYKLHTSWSLILAISWLQLLLCKPTRIGRRLQKSRPTSELVRTCCIENPKWRTFATSRSVVAGWRTIAQESIPALGTRSAIHTRLGFALRWQHVTRRSDSACSSEHKRRLIIDYYDLLFITWLLITITRPEEAFSGLLRLTGILLASERCQIDSISVNDQIAHATDIAVA